MVSCGFLWLLTVSCGFLRRRNTFSKLHFEMKSRELQYSYNIIPYTDVVKTLKVITIFNETCNDVIRWIHHYRIFQSANSDQSIHKKEAMSLKPLFSIFVKMPVRTGLS
jgi:hypothetical protein